MRNEIMNEFQRDDYLFELRMLAERDFGEEEAAELCKIMDRALKIAPLHEFLDGFRRAMKAKPDAGT